MSDRHPNQWTAGQRTALIQRISATAPGTRVAERMLSEGFEVRFAESPLLTLVHTFTPTGAKPTIAWTSPQFKAWFDDVAEGERSAELSLHRLERRGTDKPIIDALGGERAAKRTLADFYAALAEKEERRDLTSLLGYAEDDEGVLRTVFADWDDDGWRVNAYSVEDPGEWCDGFRVLSRN